MLRKNQDLSLLVVYVAKQDVWLTCMYKMYNLRVCTRCMTYVCVAKQDVWLTCMLRNKMHDLRVCCETRCMTYQQSCGAGTQISVSGFRHLEVFDSGFKRNFWLMKSLTSHHLRMRRVMFQVMHFASGGCSLRYQLCWELIIRVWGLSLWLGFRVRKRQIIDVRDQVNYF